MVVERILFLLLVAAAAGPAGPTAYAQPLTARDLLTAARKGDIALVKRALEARVPVDAEDPTFRQTALIRAAMFGQAEAARLLVASRASVEHTAAPDGMRALHWAAKAGSAEVIRVLLSAGAAPDAKDGLDTTPLEYALAAGAPAAVDALVAGGASAEQMREPIARHVGRALNDDAPGPRVEALVALIRAGRGLETASSMPDERTALLSLAGRANRPGAERIAQALVAAGAQLAATDERGRTARQIVEAWVPGQRDPAYRRTLEAVLAVLRQAEARR